jgi:hypothetical protein
MYRLAWLFTSENGQQADEELRKNLKDSNDAPICWFVEKCLIKQFLVNV